MPKFTDLGRRLVDGIGGNASMVVIDGASHAPHLQQPHQVAGVVRKFLSANSLD